MTTFDVAILPTSISNEYLDRLKQLLEAKNLRVSYYVPDSGALENMGEYSVDLIEQPTSGSLVIYPFTESSEDLIHSDAGRVLYHDRISNHKIPVLPLVLGRSMNTHVQKGDRAFASASSACVLYEEDFSAEQVVEIICLKLLRQCEVNFESQFLQHLQHLQTKHESIGGGLNIIMVHPFERPDAFTERLEKYLQRELYVDVFCDWPGSIGGVRASKLWSPVTLADLWGSKSVGERLSELVDAAHCVIVIDDPKSTIKPYMKDVVTLFDDKRRVQVLALATKIAQQLPEIKVGHIKFTRLVECLPILLVEYPHPHSQEQSVIVKDLGIKVEESCICGQSMSLRGTDEIGCWVFEKLFGIHPANYDAVIDRRKANHQQPLEKPTSTPSVSVRLQLLELSEHLVGPPSGKQLLPIAQLLQDNIQKLISDFNTTKVSTRFIPEQYWCSHFVIAGNGLLEHLLRETVFQLHPQFVIDRHPNMHTLWGKLTDLNAISLPMTVSNLEFIVNRNGRLELRPKEQTYTYTICNPAQARNTVYHVGCQPNQYYANSILALLCQLWSKLLGSLVIADTDSPEAIIKREVLSMPALVRGFNDDHTNDRQAYLRQKVSSLSCHDSAHDVCGELLQFIQESLHRLGVSYNSSLRDVALDEIIQHKQLEKLFHDHRKRDFWDESPAILQLYNRLRTIKILYEDPLQCQEQLEDRLAVFKFAARYMAMILEHLLVFCRCNADEAERPVSFVSFRISGILPFPGYRSDNAYSRTRANPHTKATETPPGSGIYVYDCPTIDLAIGTKYIVQAVLIQGGKPTDYLPHASLKIKGNDTKRMKGIEPKAKKRNLISSNQGPDCQEVLVSGPLSKLNSFLEEVVRRQLTGIPGFGCEYILDKGREFTTRKERCSVRFVCSFDKSTLDIYSLRRHLQEGASVTL